MLKHSLLLYKNMFMSYYCDHSFINVRNQKHIEHYLTSPGFISTILKNALLARPASSSERLYNGRCPSVRPSVCLSVPSIASSSDVQLVCCSPISINGSHLHRAQSGQRYAVIREKRVDADLSLTGGLGLHDEHNTLL